MSGNGTENENESRPLEGMIVGGCLHVTKETAVLVETLVAAGAKVAWSGCNPLSTKDDISAAVKGSQESATMILNKAAEENLEIGVHYCSSSFKDGIQLKNRIKRRANNIVREHEIISDEGTLLKGVIYPKNTASLKEIYMSLKDEFNISEKHIFLNRDKSRIEVGLWILEKIAPELKKRGLECYMVEEYPTADSLEVERIPLPL